MAATVTSRLSVALNSILANSLGLAAGQAVIDVNTVSAIASGTGANQADRVFSERAKSISAAYSPDLAGSLLDAFGAAFTPARIKALVVNVDPTSGGNLIIGGDANALLIGFGAAAQTFAVKPGGLFVMYAPDATGWPVVAGTGDILKFNVSAGTVIFDWAILGASI